MELINALDDVMTCIHTRTNDDISVIYPYIQHVWNIIQSDLNKENYIYQGQFFFAAVLDPDEEHTKQDVIDAYENYSLGYKYEAHAILLAKVTKKKSEMFDIRNYPSYILSGYTSEGIDISAILNDYPNEKSLWDFMRLIRYEHTAILINPGSIKDLHIIK